MLMIILKRKGEESMTPLPEPFAVTICAPMRLSAMLVVDGLATASCTLHPQPMPVKPPQTRKEGCRWNSPLCLAVGRTTPGVERLPDGAPTRHYQLPYPTT